MNTFREMLAKCRRRNAESIRFLDELNLELMSPAQQQEAAALRSEIAAANAMIDEVEAEFMTVEALDRSPDRFATVLRNILNPGSNIVPFTPAKPIR